MQGCFATALVDAAALPPSLPEAMRLLPLPALVLVLLAALASPPAYATPSTAPKTAAVAPPAIIPGSPLAHLAAALPAPSVNVAAPPDISTLAPFGTGMFGGGATHWLDHFVAHAGESLRLAPLLAWLGGLPGHTDATDALADIGQGLAEVLLPALLVDVLLRLILRGPRRFCARRAGPGLDTATGRGLADAEAGETELPPSATSLRAWGRRVGLGLAAFSLALLPLAGFAATLTLLLGAGFPNTDLGALAVTGAGNAYLTLRALWEGARFLLAPSAPSLRLLPLTNAQATAMSRGAAVLLASVFVAYLLVTNAEIAGLPHAGEQVLARYAALVVHVELAWMIWRSRATVRGWIAGAPEASSAPALLRQRLGGVWHYAALFYVLALWVAWVGGVPNAFATLLRVVVVLLVAVLAGRLAWWGAARLLERLFLAPEDDSPALLARARAYNPLLRLLVRGVILAAVLLLILQGWGVNALGWLLADPLSRFLLDAVVAVGITLVLALAMWEALNLLLQDRISRLDDSGHLRQAARLRTLTPLLRTTIGTLIVIIALFAALTEIGVNAPSLAAGAGVVGIAIGFGSQKLVQDLITGLFLLAEDVLQVGDVVSLGGVTGTVENLSIRTIRLRGADGSVNIIPFSSVANVTNMTRDFGTAQVTVHVAYDADIDAIFALLQDIAAQMREEPLWNMAMRDDLKLFGLDEFGTLGLSITGQIRTAPGKHWAVRREFYRRVQIRFKADGIAIPHDNSTFKQPEALPPDIDQHPAPAGAPLGGDEPVQVLRGLGDGEARDLRGQPRPQPLEGGEKP